MVLGTFRVRHCEYHGPYQCDLQLPQAWYVGARYDRTPDVQRQGHDNLDHAVGKGFHISGEMECLVIFLIQYMVFLY